MLIAAIRLTAFAQRSRRKPTLLAAILGFLLFDTVTALSSSYALTLAARSPSCGQPRQERRQGGAPSSAGETAEPETDAWPA